MKSCEDIQRDNLNGRVKRRLKLLAMQNAERAGQQWSETVVGEALKELDKDLNSR